MYKKAKVLALIVARGGSKRLPHKNIKLLHSKPLICWSVDAIKDIKSVEEVILSTDSQEIANVANTCGVRTPFIRPKKLALDETKSVDVVIHAIEWLKEHEKKEFDFVILLQPTSPLRTKEDIEGAFTMLYEREADAVISVCKVEHSPLWSNTLDKDRSLEGFLKPEYKNSRSQDLEEYYRLNGAIYICRVDKLLSERTFFISNKIYAYEMSQMHSVDIDTELDFLIAETILKSKEK